MIVSFDDDSYRYLYDLASKRNEKSPYTKNRRISNIDDLTINFMGVLGEAAVARVLGAQFDRNVYQFRGDTHSADISTSDLGGIEVKTTRMDSRSLILNGLDELIHDIYILCYVSVIDRHVSCDVDIVGWTNKENFIKNYRSANYGYGDRVVLDELNLAPVEWICVEDC